MRLLFYLSLILLIAFEIANVYFIMPMPGSQESDTVDLAYTLYSYRWYTRAILSLCLIIGFLKTWNLPRKWFRVVSLLPLFAIVYLFNFVMVADHMFLQPKDLILKDASQNEVPLDRIIIGVSIGGEAKAYPVEYLAYHHQVRDRVGEKSIMVTYCSVCRTGRIYEPLVNGKEEEFRLVGMDHFNAMFEDKSTGSWWRQANGEAITGELKGSKMPEVESVQMSLGQWLELYPNSLIMQPDPTLAANYDPEAKFEKGLNTGSLTGTNKNSWERKSWVVGITLNGESRAYDWNQLKSQKIITDQLGGTNLALVLADDTTSFTAFEIPSPGGAYLQNNQLHIDSLAYDLSGAGINHEGYLKRVNAYQEFWHSWQTFHPTTSQYK